MDRGIVLAFPFVWGTHLTNQWFLSGSNDWKIQHILDFIDISIFLKDKITPKLGVYANTPSGGLTALASSLWEPFLFNTLVAIDPISNLLNYSLKNKLESVEHSKVISEFGDAGFWEIYEIQKLFSPIHIPFPERIQTDMLIQINW